MSSGRNVTIRLSNERYMLYEMKATAVGKRPATYIKELLETTQQSNSGNGENGSLKLEKILINVSDSLEALSLKADKILNAVLSNEKTEDTGIDNVTFELLVMLRAMAKPEQQKVAHSRMREKGIPILNLEDY